MLRNFPAGEATHQPGDTITVGIFAAGELVKVTGTSKGRGFQGIVHRYGAGGGPASHGNTRHRKPGSIGPGTDPSRVIKGKRMPGHRAPSVTPSWACAWSGSTPTATCCSSVAQCPARATGS